MSWLQSIWSGDREAERRSVNELLEGWSSRSQSIYRIFRTAMVFRRHFSLETLMNNEMLPLIIRNPLCTRFFFLFCFLSTAAEWLSNENEGWFESLDTEVQLYVVEVVLHLVLLFTCAANMSAGVCFLCVHLCVCRFKDSTLSHRAVGSRNCGGDIHTQTVVQVYFSVILRSWLSIFSHPLSSYPVSVYTLLQAWSILNII